MKKKSENGTGLRFDKETNKLFENLVSYINENNENFVKNSYFKYGFGKTTLQRHFCKIGLAIHIYDCENIKELAKQIVKNHSPPPTGIDDKRINQLIKNVNGSYKMKGGKKNEETN